MFGVLFIKYSFIFRFELDILNSMNLSSHDELDLTIFSSSLRDEILLCIQGEHEFVADFLTYLLT